MLRIRLAPAPPVLLAAVLLTSAGLAAAQEDIRGQEKKIDIAWTVVETEHYAIHHESVIPRETVDKVGVELEDILEQYVGIFRVEPKGPKLVVKFMDSSNTYIQEGGDQSHPGMYIERGAEKFLLIQQMAFYQLIPLVYHEAFHQYLATYLEGVRAPTWFNEGMAMYYEGMQRGKGGKLDPWAIDKRKLRMVKDAVFTRSHIPLQKLVDSTYEEFHDKDTEALHYNQSFAFVYFLMQVKRGKLVLDYAKTLKKSGDPEEALEELLGKKRKKLDKTESTFKKFVLATTES